MKALSLWQPWASLIALGAKQYETRSWQTAYRGPLAIHAAKNRSELDYCYSEPFCSSLKAGGLYKPSDLPFGAVVCIVDLVSISRTATIYSEIGDQERAFGNYSPGRYAWELQLVKRLAPPVPARGAQGLWEWASDVCLYCGEPAVADVEGVPVCQNCGNGMLHGEGLRRD